MKKEDEISNFKEKPFGKKEKLLMVIFVLIGIVFFVLLNIVTESGFGLVEILFSIVFGLVVTGILVWTKSISSKNAYLGIGIGLIVMFILGYSFYLNFKGPYSLGFMILTGLIIGSYLIMNFLKFRNQDKYFVGEFDDS